MSAFRQARRQLLANGTAWTTTVDGGRVERIDDVDHLVFDLTLRPPGGTVTDFRLTYDAIAQRLLSHRIFASPDGTEAAAIGGRRATVSARSGAARRGPHRAVTTVTGCATVGGVSHRQLTARLQTPGNVAAYP